MEGNEASTSDNKDYQVSKDVGVYLGPSESAMIQPAEAVALGRPTDSRIVCGLSRGGRDRGCGFLCTVAAPTRS